MNEASSVYFGRPLGDWLCMGGISVAAFVGFFLFPGPMGSTFSLSAASNLLWFINWPHFSASLDRLYGRKENLRDFPFTTLVIPFFILLGVLLSLRTEAFATAWVRLYFLWAPYHFSGQTTGIVVLYLRRANIRLSRWERRWLSAGVYGIAFGMMAKVESYVWTQKFVGVSYSSLALPWDGSGALWTVGAVSLGIFAVLLGRREGRNIPAIIAAPLLAHVSWFGFGWKISEYQNFVPLFHSLQYLPLIAFFQLQAAPAKETRWRWYRKNFLGGAILFWALPLVATFFGFPLSITQPVIFAAINIHHFWIDGIIWKLRNPKVAAALALPPTTALDPVAKRDTSLIPCPS